jgi:hypothetical protein
MEERTALGYASTYFVVIGAAMTLGVLYYAAIEGGRLVTVEVLPFLVPAYIIAAFVCLPGYAFSRWLLNRLQAEDFLSFMISGAVNGVGTALGIVLVSPGASYLSDVEQADLRDLGMIGLIGAASGWVAWIWERHVRPRLGRSVAVGSKID